MQLFVCFSGVFFLYFADKRQPAASSQQSSACKSVSRCEEKLPRFAEIFAVKSHLHNAAPEIVISRFAVVFRSRICNFFSVFCIFFHAVYYYSAHELHF